MSLQSQPDLSDIYGGFMAMTLTCKVVSGMLQAHFSDSENNAGIESLPLTTAEPNTLELDEIDLLTDEIHAKTGIEIIVNGVMSSLNYYLRLLPQPELFIDQYTHNLRLDFDRSTDIKQVHLQRWQDILATLP